MQYINLLPRQRAAPRDAISLRNVAMSLICVSSRVISACRKALRDSCADVICPSTEYQPPTMARPATAQASRLAK